jgi:hypothetical protein
MKRVLVSPIFNYPAKYFTGDNVAHYLPGKFLWHVCNKVKTGFHQSIDNVYLDEPVSLNYIFHSQQPQNLYFKKPEWIDRFMGARDEQEINKIAKSYDFFANLYRYRGKNPSEVNVGYSSDLKVLNIDLVAYTHKAIYDHDLYIDDLELSDKYREFLQEVTLEMNPDRRPVIVLHKRTDDPWDRHLADYDKLNEKLLFDLLDTYRDHIFVLVGDPFSWKYYHHPRIKYLTKYINRREMLRRMKEHNAALQYILSGYFCADAEMAFIGISGFTLFLESIRPRNLMPPVPVFWGPYTFTGIDTCIQKVGWYSSEFERYKHDHPEDAAFRHQVHHFMYYSRDEDILKPYCMDYPNSCEKAMNVLTELENRTKRPHPHRTERDRCDNGRHQSMYEAAVNTVWAAKYNADKMTQKTAGMLKRLAVISRDKEEFLKTLDRQITRRLKGG